MLGIEDNYTAFCVDEASIFLYSKMVEEAKNKAELKNLVDKHSVSKKKKM